MFYVNPTPPHRIMVLAAHEGQSITEAESKEDVLDGSPPSEV